MFECFQFSSNLRKCSKFKIILQLKKHNCQNVDQKNLNFVLIKNNEKLASRHGLVVKADDLEVLSSNPC